MRSKKQHLRKRNNRSARVRHNKHLNRLGAAQRRKKHKILRRVQSDRSTSSSDI